VEDAEIRVVRVSVRVRMQGCWQSLRRWQYAVDTKAAGWYVVYLARFCSILDFAWTIEGRLNLVSLYMGVYHYGTNAVFFYLETVLFLCFKHRAVFF
jgi:hypothetical protein